MYDLGHKFPEPETVGEGKNKKSYPSICLDGEEIPELDSKKVGSKVALKMLGIIRGINKNDEGTRYEIEFHKAEVASKVSESEYNNMSDDEKDEYDKESMADNEE